MEVINVGINETVKSTVLVDELNLWELPEKCDRCGFPMHLRSGGSIAICPPCTAKKEQAMNGRAILAKVKAEWEKRKIKPREDIEYDYNPLFCAAPF